MDGNSLEPPRRGGTRTLSWPTPAWVDSSFAPCSRLPASRGHGPRVREAWRARSPPCCSLGRAALPPARPLHSMG